MTRVAILVSRIRVEEKLLLASLETAGASVQVVDDGELVLEALGRLGSDGSIQVLESIPTQLA